MIILHSSGGSQEIIEENKLEDESWRQHRDSAIRLLTGRLHTEAANFLQATPFKLYNGTNGFGDEFFYIGAALNMESYIIIGETTPHHKTLARQISSTLGEIGMALRFVVVRMQLIDQSTTHVSAPLIESPSRVLQECLRSAESDIQSGNHISAVDRLHTAFHAYLRSKCSERGIQLSGDESVTRLFRILRDSIELRNDHVQRIVMSCSAVVDAVNTIRNHNSLSHPNEELLDIDDALFVTNIIKSVFSLINSKL